MHRTIRSKLDLTHELKREVRAAQVAVAARDAAIRERLGLNITDHRCLDLLHQHGAMTPGALADALALSRSAVTTVLDRLESQRYVRRVPSREDRRQLRVELTPLLLRRAGQLYGDGTDVDAELARYSAAELELLCEFVRRDREYNERSAAKLLRAARKARAAG